jgi:ribosomal protein S18 acetylase RimI-like enzyme
MLPFGDAQVGSARSPEQKQRAANQYARKRRTLDEEIQELEQAVAHVSILAGRKGGGQCAPIIGIVNRIEEPYRIRRALAEDAPALKVLIDLSVRALQAQDYSPAQIEGALGSVFGVDSQLIADGTYLVAEVVGDGGKKAIAGCGGWSKRKTLFGSDQVPGREDGLLDPRTDDARIRAFFVHPDWARRGIGGRILAACEDAAIAAGFKGFELGATLSGERLYKARGYRVIERITVPLANGASMPVIRMWKGT